MKNVTQIDGKVGRHRLRADRVCVCVSSKHSQVAAQRTMNAVAFETIQFSFFYRSISVCLFCISFLPRAPYKLPGTSTANTFFSAILNQSGIYQSVRTEFFSTLIRRFRRFLRCVTIYLHKWTSAKEIENIIPHSHSFGAFFPIFVCLLLIMNTEFIQLCEFMRAKSQENLFFFSSLVYIFANHSAAVSRLLLRPGNSFATSLRVFCTVERAEWESEVVRPENTYTT